MIRFGKTNFYLELLFGKKKRLLSIKENLKGTIQITQCQSHLKRASSNCVLNTVYLWPKVAQMTLNLFRKVHNHHPPCTDTSISFSI